MEFERLKQQDRLEIENSSVTAFFTLVRYRGWASPPRKGCAPAPHFLYFIGLEKAVITGKVKTVFTLHADLLYIRHCF
jgi:hypothetical protein